MGGSVNIGIRDPEGRVLVSESYTSCINPFFDNYQFFNINMFHFNKFLLEGSTFPVCDGYGLVFGDFLTKTIHSLQGYTSLHQFDFMSLSMDLSNRIIVDDQNFRPSERFKELYENGMISKIYSLEKDISDNEEQLDQTLSATVQLTKCTGETNPWDWRYFSIDTDFKILNYSEEPNGYIQLKKNLDEAGIIFTDVEEVEWQDLIDSRIQSYLEDEDNNEWKNQSSYRKLI